jgi:hypothetical protein
MPQHAGDSCPISEACIQTIADMVKSSSAELQRLEDLVKSGTGKKQGVTNDQRPAISKSFWLKHKTKLGLIQQKLRANRDNIMLALVGVNTIRK